jgi:hypothetical protein
VTFGEALRVARGGRSLRAVAAEAGIDWSCWGRMERGELLPPRGETLKRVVEVAGDPVLAELALTGLLARWAKGGFRDYVLERPELGRLLLACYEHRLISEQIGQVVKYAEMVATGTWKAR